MVIQQVELETQALLLAVAAAALEIMDHKVEVEVMGVW